MDVIGGILKVSLTDDTNEVVISHPVSRANSQGPHEIVIQPRYARHLAHVLIEHANLAETEQRAKEMTSLRRAQSRRGPTKQD
jgi:hypothetical protein